MKHKHPKSRDQMRVNWYLHSNIAVLMVEGFKKQTIQWR